MSITGEKQSIIYYFYFQGLGNDLKAALDKIDQQYFNELVAGQEPSENDTQNDLKVHEENTTIEELEVCILTLLVCHPLKRIRSLGFIPVDVKKVLTYLAF